MHAGRRVFVVVPAYREARLIAATLRSMPAWVDGIVVVDDASDDGTSTAVARHHDPRVRLLRHDQNLGVGAAIRSGYLEAVRSGADVMAVMAGDHQMHPDDLARVVDPVCHDAADYVKGNRFIHPEAKRMPWQRRAGSRVLSSLTRRATGLAVDDTQCGYTAISAAAVRRLPWEDLWPRFGYPNDLLGLLAALGLRVAEVPVRPVYADERSGLRPWHLVTIAGVIIRRRLKSGRERATRWPASAQLVSARSTSAGAQRSA